MVPSIVGQPLALVGGNLLVSHSTMGALACSLKQFIGHATRFQSTAVSVPENARQVRLL